MYFYRKGKDQFLDLTGNFILSHNDVLIKARSKSASPTKVLNATFILNVTKLKFFRKLQATYFVISFIWGKNQALVAENTALKKPYVKDGPDITEQYGADAQPKDYDTETEGREDCPVIKKHCEYYAYRCDSNGEVVIDYCKHPHNPTETEGNAVADLCPL